MDIGVRQPGCAGKMGFDKFCAWAKSVGYAAVDVPRLTPEIKQILSDNGLQPGTVDLPSWGAQLSPDPERRKAGLAEQKEILSVAKELGASVAFAVLLPEDKNQPRGKSFEYWCEAADDFVALLDELDMHLAIEAWPGGAPQFPSLGVTPETLQAMFAKQPSMRLGLCYDPSHLIRLGVDHMRFLNEFGPRVKHVHGKDTELLPEGAYLTGNLPPSLGGGYRFGEKAWRYTIPGEGTADWTKIRNRLSDVGYGGLVCVELEDHNYGLEIEDQQLGLVKSVNFLKSVFC